MRDYPLISCIMPTRNRRHLIERAIESFRMQTWKNKELVIADNGDEDHVGDIAWKYGAIYRRIDGARRTTGEMRNICVAASHGDYIAHFDDDDWSHPRRLLEQWKLMMSCGKPVVGYRSIVFADEEADRAWYFVSIEDYDYALGASLFYRRSYWKARDFPHRIVGEDDHFVHRAVNDGDIKAVAGHHRLVALIHPHNTSSKIPDEQWHKVSMETIRRLGYPERTMENLHALHSTEEHCIANSTFSGTGGEPSRGHSGC